jgi:ATP-dependent Clp protease ATP-binding subunit ClpA
MPVTRGGPGKTSPKSLASAVRQFIRSTVDAYSTSGGNTLFERFSKSAREVVVKARSHAIRMHQTEVRAEHLLLALAAPGSGSAARVLNDNGLTSRKIEDAMASTTALQSDQGPVTQADVEALKTIGVDLDEVVRQMEGTLGPGALARSPARDSRFKRLTFSAEAKRALAASLAAATQQGADDIGADHILLGVLAQKRSLAVELLELFDITPEGLRDQVLVEERRAS